MLAADMAEGGTADAERAPGVVPAVASATVFGPAGGAVVLARSSSMPATTGGAARRQEPPATQKA
jgi:hypothetical protein